MNIQTCTFLGWLSFSSAERLGLGEICGQSRNCMTKNCVYECGSGVSTRRCIESKSFFLHHDIDFPKCISSSSATILSNKLLQASSDLGQTCDNNENCVTRNCVSICGEHKSEGICVEPIH